MTSWWHVVEVQDNDHGPEPLGQLLTFCVAPSLAIFKDERSVDRILHDANVKGYEIAFCSSLSGIGRFQMEKLSQAILRWLAAHGYTIKNRFDIDIEPKARILIP